MSNNIKIARELLNRNITGFNRDIEEFAEFLANNYTEEELLNTKELRCCSFCGGEVQMQKTILEDNRILYSPECTQCHVGSEIYFSEELAILSHNTESWFNDGIK